jgi:hypothetical protein
MRLPILMGLLIVAVLVYFVYSCQNPSDRVRLYATNIPRGTDFLSVAALRGGRLHSMAWSPKHIFDPMTMHPADCSWSHLIHPNNPQVDWAAYVRWQWGDRYGIVTRDTEGNWRITWFDISTVSLEGHKPLLGGGEVRFDMSQGVTEPLTDRQRTELGFDNVEKRH